MKLNCISFLCEFAQGGVPTTNFDGGRSSQRLNDVFFPRSAQGSEEALKFLLEEAELRFPYCKTTLSKGDFGSNRPVAGSRQPVGTRTGNISGGTDVDTNAADTAGLVSPLMRDESSTILFGCLFKEHTTETIDVEAAHQTFRTLTKVLTPGIDAFFRSERHKAKNRIQEALLLGSTCPTVLMTSYKELLGHSASGLERLLATGSVRFSSSRFEFKNKQLETALQDVLDTFARGGEQEAQQENSRGTVKNQTGGQSVCLEDPDGRLKRITIRAATSAAARNNNGSAPWVILQIFETSDLSAAVETVLQDRFELSHSEAHLARHLTMSGSINDTVQELGITRNTAKTHLRRIFDKTGVNTQLQLARLVHGISRLF
nr:hypothetical protein [uncultured Roseibium sp.]